MPKPTYRLEVAGRPLPVPPTSVEIVDVLGPASDLLRIEVPWEYQGQPRHGVKVKAALGYAGQSLHNYGDFAVNAVDFHWGPQGGQLVVSAGTPELLGENSTIKAPRTRSWEDRSLSDILSTIAQANGLGARVASGLQGVRVRFENQIAESDLAFLDRIARNYGGQFTIKDGTAMIVQKGGGQKLVRTSNHPTHVVRLAEMLSADANFLDAPDYKAVAAKWIDLGTGEEHRVLAGSGEPIYEIRHPHGTEAEARLAAQSQFEELQRETAELRLALPGRPEIRAGHLVTCRTRGLPVDGREWFVEQAHHRYSDAGLGSILECTAANTA